MSKKKQKQSQKQKQKQKQTTVPLLRSPLVSFLGEELSRRADEENGFVNLAGAVTKAYLEHLADPRSFSKRGQIIYRQKLSQLADGDRSVKLSIQELEALHCYFQQYDLGLDRQPLFSQSTVLHTLATSKTATCFIGARMTQEGAHMSHFDWLAMVEVQRAVHRLGSTLVFDMFDVYGTKMKKRERPRPWTRMFGQSPAVVCIASPRANQASERALCEMLRLGKGPTPWNHVPFYFVWLEERAINQQRSRLARTPEQVRKKHPDLAEHAASGDGWGLVVGDRVFQSEHATRKGGEYRTLKESIRSHALIVAQRRRGGQICVVVAGVNGPGTYLGATHLPWMRRDLPLRGGPHSDAILWGVVEGTVDTESMVIRGQLPETRDASFVVGPSLWDPKKREAIDAT